MTARPGDCDQQADEVDWIAYSIDPDVVLRSWRCCRGLVLDFRYREYKYADSV
jgi:hypothetical protein